MRKKKTSKDWIIKRNRDLFFKYSKVLEYRSRSAFKLIEINDKFKILTKNTYLLDLGSNPGGWSQVASQKIKKGKILAVDIKQMKKIKNVNFLLGNFLTPFVKKEIETFFKQKIDVVISDMASNTIGNKSLDSYKINELCMNAMEFAKLILKNKGIFVSKFFMGSEFEEIKRKANGIFEKVVNFKPNSSKKESREVYIIGKNIIN